MSNIGFRDFLLNEQHAYLSEKVGDILSALHDLEDNGQAMGSRQLMQSSEAIVRQIRRILHSQWPRSEQHYLPILQKVGVAIMRSIDGKADKGELKEILTSSKGEIEQLTAKMGMPQNALASPDSAPETAKPALQPSQGKAPPKPKAPEPAPASPPPDPNAAAAPAPPAEAPAPQ